MSAVWDGGSSVAGAPGFLDKECIVAGSGFNRWLVPPAALSIHLCMYGGDFATAQAYLADLFGRGMLAVSIPMAWGVYKTLLNVGKSFN